MEQEMAGLATPSTPATTDGCGCMPRSASAADPPTCSDQPPEHQTPTEAAATPEASRRSLKLVVTLMPVDGGQYRATLALGADNCDPVLRSTTVAGLSDALSQVPALHHEAEASWQAHPRNPTVARAPVPQPDGNRRRPSKSTTSPVDEPTPTPGPDLPTDARPSAPDPAEDALTPRSAGGGQLTLFG
jgi:hypothetical protein